MSEHDFTQHPHSYDVLVAGGGPAGLGGALQLGRARRSVLVADAGHPRNAPAGGVHAYPGREGAPPAELLADAREEVSAYGVRTVRAAVVAAKPDDGGFLAELDDGTAVRARRLLVATGLVDELPDVPGLAELWGTDVLHCPYCHGWEVRDQPVGILATDRTGPLAVHQALLWRQWSDDITLFLHTAADPDDEQFERLAARGVAVVDGEVRGLERDAAGRLSGVRPAGGPVLPCRALVVPPQFTVRSPLFASLGLEPVERDMGGTPLGTVLPTDATGRTPVPGVWAAGNVVDPSAQVIGAAAAGVHAGAMINFDLVEEETRRAVDAARRGQ
ncbi:NAD(P)/FAD-dependent oxidoreductase [Streptomyces boncukensis]|uniref:NAD(P)/FAD-dependent oxidoreductase n=1 Tax=Streptomyces boncukensis TaxID=2711219 RepID=A0A6G4X4U7_9ACTN|nr:NAD(P)/FAD-dependent oxidoreductase [Streptomyces boncukensis]NGO72418.1 NAD(P)/FAD-dependent oxidoreductase [Streptomyces boncukensis]